MNEQAAEEEKVAKRQAAAKPRAVRHWVSRLEAALREVERLQENRKHLPLFLPLLRHAKTADSDITCCGHYYYGGQATSAEGSQ